jgi:hypothetical protein
MRVSRPVTSLPQSIHALCLLGAALLTDRPAHGELVAFEFSGTVLAVFDFPYGIAASAPAPLSGRFVYDTESAVTHTIDGCDCAGYRQIRSDGFQALIGEIRVRADEYIVEVDNNFPQGQGGAVADIFTVIFSSAANPPLSKPLIVNGEPQLAGLFSLNLGDLEGDLFSTPLLPPSLNLADFHERLLLFSDSPSGVDIYANITSLTAIELIAGDYDYNSISDGVDFLKWQRSVGTPDLAADGNGDGIVNADDLDVWKFGFGGSPSRFGSLIPEPCAATLIAFASSLAVILRNRGTNE